MPINQCIEQQCVEPSMSCLRAAHWPCSSTIINHTHKHELSEHYKPEPEAPSRKRVWQIANSGDAQAKLAVHTAAVNQS